MNGGQPYYCISQVVTLATVAASFVLLQELVYRSNNCWFISRLCGKLCMLEQALIL